MMRVVRYFSMLRFFKLALRILRYSRILSILDNLRQLITKPRSYAGGATFAPPIQNRVKVLYFLEITLFRMGFFEVFSSSHTQMKTLSENTLLV